MGRCAWRYRSARMLSVMSMMEGGHLQEEEEEEEEEEDPNLEEEEHSHDGLQLSKAELRKVSPKYFTFHLYISLCNSS